MKHLIVHYHIFKNAGSTIDHILGKNFGKTWLTFDGEKAHSRISPEELENFISSHPDVRALSSHNAILPVPTIPGISIFPIIFLRHPLDRVRSIYDFERHQGLTSGPISRGAEHAAKLSFEDYIHWRFDFTKNGVTHNHHTSWLLHTPRFNRFEIQQQDYDQALQTLISLPFFGLVEKFDESLSLLSTNLHDLGIKAELEYQIQNHSKHAEKTLDERLSYLRQSIGESTWEMITERNQWDLKLYVAAQEVFQTRVDQLDIHY